MKKGKTQPMSNCPEQQRGRWMRTASPRCSQLSLTFVHTQRGALRTRERSYGGNTAGHRTALPPLLPASSDADGCGKWGGLAGTRPCRGAVPRTQREKAPQQGASLSSTRAERCPREAQPAKKTLRGGSHRSSRPEATWDESSVSTHLPSTCRDGAAAPRPPTCWSAAAAPRDRRPPWARPGGEEEEEAVAHSARPPARPTGEPAARGRRHWALPGGAGGGGIASALAAGAAAPPLPGHGPALVPACRERNPEAVANERTRAVICNSTSAPRILTKGNSRTCTRAPRTNTRTGARARAAPLSRFGELLPWAEEAPLTGELPCKKQLTWEEALLQNTRNSQRSSTTGPPCEAPRVAGRTAGSPRPALVL